MQGRRNEENEREAREIIINRPLVSLPSLKFGNILFVSHSFVVFSSSYLHHFLIVFVVRVVAFRCLQHANNRKLLLFRRAIWVILFVGGHSLAKPHAQLSLHLGSPRRSRLAYMPARSRLRMRSVFDLASRRFVVMCWVGLCWLSFRLLCTISRLLLLLCFWFLVFLVVCLWLLSFTLLCSLSLLLTVFLCFLLLVLSLCFGFLFDQARLPASIFH